LIVRFGKYKVFPIAGTALSVIGLFLLSHLGTGTSLVTADLYMAVLGVGLGLTMQVLVLAVQNAVSYENLGVATSTATLFRSMGGTIGVPLFGAIFTNHLAHSLGRVLPPEVIAKLPSRLGPAQIDALPPAIRDPYIAAWDAALKPIFLIASAIAVLGFVLTWFLDELPLRETVADQGIRDTFAAPRDATSLAELETRLSTLSRKQNRHLVYSRLCEQAGVEVDPPSAWLLLRLAEEEAASPAELASRFKLDPAVVDAMLAEIRKEGFVETDAPRLTETGRAAASRLADARRDSVTAIVEDWKPEEQPEVKSLIEVFAEELGSAPPLLA
jgi:DNA-binding MarR family transcriptional regulator